MQHKIVIEHHIQRDILKRLSVGALRFSQLKPAGMENNIFMYHLKALRGLALVEKHNDQYRLTPAGLTYIDHLSNETFRPRLQPKIIAVLMVQDTQGQLATLTRHHEPYAGSLMLPSGKMHVGETLASHAARELVEKTGLATPMAYAGLANIMISQDDTVLTHALAHLWRATLAGTPTLTCQDQRFNAQWSSTLQIAANGMPGTSELLALYGKNTQTDIQSFAADLTLTVKDAQPH